MWYFTWILGLGFAVCFAVINAMWLEMDFDYQNRALHEKDEDALD